MTQPSRSTRRPRFEPPTVVLVFLGATVATVVFTVLGVAQLIGIANAHHDFARFPVPGESVRWVPTPGINAVWVEPADAEVVNPDSIAITEVASGRVIPIRSRSGVARYETLSRSGRTIGEIDISERGLYAVVAKDDARGSLAIGPVPPDQWYRWAWVWFGLGGLGLAVAVVSGVVARRVRRRSVDDDDLVSA